MRSVATGSRSSRAISRHVLSPLQRAWFSAGQSFYGWFRGNAPAIWLSPFTGFPTPYALRSCAGLLAGGYLVDGLDRNRSVLLLPIDSPAAEKTASEACGLTGLSHGRSMPRNVHSEMEARERAGTGFQSGFPITSRKTTGPGKIKPAEAGSATACPPRSPNNEAVDFRQRHPRFMPAALKLRSEASVVTRMPAAGFFVKPHLGADAEPTTHPPSQVMVVPVM